MLPPLESFCWLDIEERKKILDYLEEFKLYAKVEVKGKTYLLKHAGIPQSATLDNLDEYDDYDFLIAYTDYCAPALDGITLVTGHQVTSEIDKNSRGKIYRNFNHIAIDVGAVFGISLACLCLDTGEEFYVD